VRLNKIKFYKLKRINISMPPNSSKNLESSVEPSERSTREILDFNLSDIKITEEMREKCEYSQKYGAGARGFKGLFYTLKEDNARRRRIRSTPLS